MVGERKEDGRDVGVDETSEEERELGEGLIRFGLVCTADLSLPGMSGKKKAPLWD